MESWIQIFFIIVVAWRIITPAPTPSPLLDDFILVADSAVGAIYQLDLLNGSVVTQLRLTNQSPVALTYCPEQQRVYWTDLTGHVIRSAGLDGKDEQVLLELKASSSPEGIAVDYKAGLAFYTDQSQRLIRVLTMDGKNVKTLFSNVKNPRSIRVDPERRQIFWTDWGSDTVERADYDGSNRHVLYQTNGSWLNSVALDLQDRRAYWLDAQTHLVQSAGLDGEGDVTTVLDATVTSPVGYNSTGDGDLPHFYGVAVDDVNVYMTDWERRGVFAVNKDGTDYRVIHRPLLVPSGIVVYQSATQVTGRDSECDTNNAGCSHLCVPIPRGHVCLCPDTHRLADNGRDCRADIIAIGPDVVWVEHDSDQTSYILGRHGDPGTYLPQRRLGVPWSVRSPLWHWSAVTGDYRGNRLLLADKQDSLLVSLDLTSNLTISILHYGTSVAVGGVAYDWVGGAIYWTDALYNTIRAARAEEGTDVIRTVINTGLDRPHGIVVWPQEGLLLWTDWGMVNKIEVSTLAGNDRHTLVDTDLNEPTGITVDYEHNRIYWSNRDSIERVDLDGSNRIRLASYTAANLVDITFYDHYIFATDQGHNGTGHKLIIMDAELPQQPFPRLQLSRMPYGVTTVSQRRQEYTKTACSDLSCHHLCVPGPGKTAQCVCTDGYDLHTDGRTCVENRRQFVGPSLVYALADRLCAVSTHNAVLLGSGPPTDPDANCFFVDSRYSFRALDYHYQTGYLYFSEVKQRVRGIRRAHMRNMTDNRAVVQGTGQVKGLAVDWSAGNLYWTDYDRGQLWVSRLDGSHQRILMTNLDKPHGVAIDQQQKQLYWSEEGEFDAVESPRRGSLNRASLDGTDAGQLQVSVTSPTGIALRQLGRRLYWVDDGEVFSVDVDVLGDPEPLSQPDENSGLIHDIAVYQDFLILSQTVSANSSGVRMLRLEPIAESVPTHLIHSKQATAYDVIVFSAQGQASTYSGDPAASCSYDYGGCDQLCLSTFSGHSCLCVDGMRPADDDLTRCVPAAPLSDNFFLVADDYRSAIYQFQRPLGTSPVSTFSLSPTERPIALAYDFMENVVFWSDFSSGVIKQATLSGERAATVYTGGPGSRIDGLAFDSESRLLYYTDTGMGYIGVVSPSGGHHRVIVSEGLDNPRAIVLDPLQGYMYYTLRNTSHGRIERRYMSGESPTVLVDTELSWPNGLAADFVNSQLYWIDAHSERIERSALDGSQRSLVLAAGRQSDPFGLAHVDGHVYWTDWARSGVYRAETDPQGGNATVTVYHGDLFRGLNDVKFYSKAQRRGPSRCTGPDNGGCSHFCLAAPGSHVCACPAGYRIDVHERTCLGVATCPAEVLHGRLDPQCSRELGTHCLFSCDEGYSPVTITALSCTQDMTWDRDTRTLCQESLCPPLASPPYTTTVDPPEGCPTQAYPGVACTQECVAGYRPQSGDTIRRCTDALDWAGEKLVCERVTCPALLVLPTASLSPLSCVQTPSPWGMECHQTCATGAGNAPGSTTSPAVVVKGSRVRRCVENGTWTGEDMVCQPGPEKTSPAPGPLSSGPSITTPIIAAIAIACATLVIIVVLAAVLVARKHAKRKAEYRNSTNLPECLPSGSLAPETSDTCNNHINDQTHSTNSETNTAASYDAKTASVHLSNGKQEAKDPETAFSNPLYIKERLKVAERQDLDHALRGEDVTPDLTAELSSV